MKRTVRYRYQAAGRSSRRWNYFHECRGDTNDAFIESWQKFIKNDKRVTNDPMEAHYIGFNCGSGGGEEGRNH